MGNKEWFQVCSPQVSFNKHISVLKTQGGSEPYPSGPSLEVRRGQRHIFFMLYRPIVRSKLDYDCIVYGTTSNINLRQLNSIHNSGLRLTLGAFCTSPISSLYTEANEIPLEGCWLKLSMYYYLKTRACVDNPAHHALHEYDGTIRLRLILRAFCTSPISSLYTEANEIPLEGRPQNGETTCRQLPKRLPDNSTIFAAEATAIILAQNYYRRMGPGHHDVVVYSDSMSCLQPIETPRTLSFAIL